MTKWRGSGVIFGENPPCFCGHLFFSLRGRPSDYVGARACNKTPHFRLFYGRIQDVEFDWSDIITSLIY